jgi:RNA-dependent RNA polymerase
VEASPECTSLWEHRYQEYLEKSRQLLELDKEEKNDEFQKLYQSYKHVSNPIFLMHTTTTRK